MSQSVPFLVSTAVDGSLRVKGEVDLSKAAYLEESLTAAIDGSVGDVLVDLSDVGFIDSAGLHALVTADSRLRAAHRSLRIVAASPFVVRLLDISGLTEHFAAVRTDLAPPSANRPPAETS